MESKNGVPGANPELTPKELMQSVGKNVEGLGRMLQRARPTTDEELKDIQLALKASAKTVKHLRKQSSFTFV